MSRAPEGARGCAGLWAICQPSLWCDVAARIRCVLPARAVGLFTHRFASGAEGGEILCADGIELPLIESYRRLSAGNPWFAALRNAGSDLIVTGADLVPPWELVRTAFYRTWLRPLSVRHSLIGTVLRDADEAVFLVVLRTPNQVPFGSADARVLGLVLPALGNAVHLAAELGSVRDLAEDLVNILGMCLEPAMIVGADGHPVILNRQAQILLSQNDGLTLRQDTLGTASKEETALLRAVIAEAAKENGPDAGEYGHAAPGRVLIRRPSGAPPLLLHVARLPRPVTDRTGRAQPAAAVLVRQPEGAEAPGMFRRCYGMTPAEARLATLIATGSSLLQAAAELGISRNTARTHMKRVYAKTDTRRQIDLMRLLGSGTGRAS